LGAALRAVRERQRLTQEELAERSGLSYKFIGEIERGVGNPTVGTLDRLAEALGVPVSSLLVETDTPSGPLEYQISRRELLRVREALDSIVEITDSVSNVEYPRPRRRPRSRKAR
jgi:transcriptional regulator with XRE-family HTH domain